MLSECKNRRSAHSGKCDFDGHDLLDGQPKGAEGRPATEPPQPEPAPQAPASSHPAPHDDALQEILAIVQPFAVRLDALQNTPELGHEKPVALACKTASPL